ncbi:hypothetical protein DVH24_006478 [Malus domestica]|uniref:Uncharacterized protein n=1 Tax=Malus domestica TaxID=3750 RepID=A0A498KCT0_MALDO|nr:hypothetical protein DVH24_006478 [Malus domestica]
MHLKINHKVKDPKFHTGWITEPKMNKIKFPKLPQQKPALRYRLVCRRNGTKWDETELRGSKDALRWKQGDGNVIILCSTNVERVVLGGETEQKFTQNSSHGTMRSTCFKCTKRETEHLIPFRFISFHVPNGTLRLPCHGFLCSLTSHHCKLARSLESSIRGCHYFLRSSISIKMVLQKDIDLLHPPAELEKRKHKIKRLVQTPNSFFMSLANSCGVRELPDCAVPAYWWS